MPNHPHYSMEVNGSKSFKKLHLIQYFPCRSVWGEISLIVCLRIWWWAGRLLWAGCWIIRRNVSPGYSLDHTALHSYESLLPRLSINDGRGLLAKFLRISVLPVKTLSLRNWESLDRYSKGRLTDPLPLAGLLLKTKGLFCCFLLMASLFWGSSDGGSL